MNGKRALLLVLALAALTAPTWFYPYFPRFDSGAYVMGIESVAAGHLPQILSHPLKPPATYPPVTMYLLAPAYALCGGSDVALRIALSLVWLAAMLVFFFARRRDDESSRLPLVLALAGTGSVWLYCGRIQSEVPYLLVTIAALACVTRLKRDDRFFGGWWGPATFLLAALVPLTRQIGLMFVAGAAAYLVWDRRRWKRGLALALLILVIGATPGVALYSVTQPRQFSPTESTVLRRAGWNPEQGQISLLSRELVGRVKMNVVGSLDLAPASLFVLDFSPASLALRIGLWLLCALMAIGFVARFIRGPTAAEFYLLGYLALLLVTPWLVETRFYTVLAPWLVLYLIEGTEFVARAVLRRDDRARLASRALVALLIAINLLSIARYHFDDRWSRRDNEQARMFAWGAAMLQRDDVLLTLDPFAFYVLYRHQGLSYAAGEQKYPPRYRLDAYLAGGGRVDAILFPASDRDMVTGSLAHFGLTMFETVHSLAGWTFGRLARAPAAP